jgi:hypothetical protein
MDGIYSILFYRITHDGALMASFYNFINSDLSSFENFMSVYYNNDKLMNTMECIDAHHGKCNGVPIKIFEKYIKKTNDDLILHITNSNTRAHIKEYCESLREMMVLYPKTIYTTV